MKLMRPVSQGSKAGEFVTRRLNGGLNYAFKYGLTASELIDGGDFDLSESGSVGSRRAMKPYTTEHFDQEVITSWAWEDKLGNDYLFAVLNDGEIVVCANGASSFGPSVFGTMTDGDSRCTPHAWSAGGWLYVSDGYRVWRWGGQGFVSYDDVTTIFTHPATITPEASNQGVPPNVAATTFRDTVFIANTLVWNTDPDAVWWSLPVAEQPEGTPLEHVLTGQEDYFENQRITFIAGAQADAINKLVAAGPNLYAFKRHSIHGLSVSGNNVLATDISTNLGLAGPEAVAAQGSDVWFYDEHEGLHVLSGGQPVKVFDPIHPLLDCARITRPWLTAVGVDGDQVFVSVCLDNDPAGYNNVTFVLNTKLSATSKGGAWSKWDVGFSSFCRWQPQNGDSSLLGFTSQFRGDTLGHPWACLRLNECSTAIVDDYGGETTIPIKPWFRTAFFDDNLPSLRKRWKWVWMTVIGSAMTKLEVDAEVSPKDRKPARCDLPSSVFNPTLVGNDTATVSIDLTPYELDGEPVCDTDSNEVKYDLGRWIPTETAGEGLLSGKIQRIVSPGRGIAFSVEVRDAGSEAAWEIDGLGVKYDAIVDLQ